MIKTREYKHKFCKVCRTAFTPTRSLQVVCSGNCALTFIVATRKAKQEKDKRKDIKTERERIKTRSDWLKDAQAVFNQYIRLRDSGKPCISCQRHHSGQYHAGHYRSVGACPELRFEELNVHLQCSVCNNHKSGNILEYRINLIKKIGQDAVDWLEGKHDPKKYTIDEIKQIISIYREKVKQVKLQVMAQAILDQG